MIASYIAPSSAVGVTEGARIVHTQLIQLLSHSKTSQSSFAPAMLQIRWLLLITEQGRRRRAAYCPYTRCDDGSKDQGQFYATRQ